MTAAIPFNARRRAKHLYWAGYTLEQVAETLDLNAATVRSWKSRDSWDQASSLERMEGVTEAQYCLLVLKDKKTGSDYKEIDLLGRQAERFARVRRYEEPGGHEGDLNPNIAARNAGPRKRKRKNHLDEEQQRQLIDAFEEGLFGYQLGWRGAKSELACSTSLKSRFILKSRQIGATFYFAREALIRAIETGNNQIFISASRAQANIFRQYIVAFVAQVCGVKLEGDPITLDLDGVTGPEGEPPKLYFLGTNYRTAQGYHGDVYIDECFWIYGFEQLNKVASAMATHKRYRKTYFSTPSTLAHEAYAMWSGDRFNRRRPKDQRVAIDISHKALQRGAAGPDGIWRQIVTIDDAEAGGCDLFDRNELELEYSPDEFSNLFLCEFVDDSQSMFPFALMRRAMVDSWITWKADFDPFALRPFGDRPVWIGYDPAESAAGDDAALVIVAPPEKPGGKFRVLEKHRLKGLDFKAQADRIIEQLDRYNVQYIGIDTTGVGKAVWEIVVTRFPLAKRLDYSVPLKTQMVLKAKNVFSEGRIEFDAGSTDIAASFMAIRAELTPSQRQVTYVASRAGDTGHADLAWAIMHALHNEPLDPTRAGTRKSRVRIFGHGQDDTAGPGRGRERSRDRNRRIAGRRPQWRRSRNRQGARVPLRRPGAYTRTA
ncbi:MAG: terminase family protein [Novosphingobium sp.]|nr:terminase family protein [Novosphingobium sp.]